MPKPDLSIIIPFYNEEKSITSLIKESFALQKKYTFELICVNNGSTDNSAKIFNLLTRRYPSLRVVTIQKNKGYGDGIMQGVRQAKGEVIAWTHADMQTSPRDVFMAFEQYKKYNDPKRIVKGNRVKRPLSAVLFSLGMAMIASLLLKKRFFEINAQPKLFHRSFLRYLNHAPQDFSLDLYLLYQAKKHYYKISTIDVVFHKRMFGSSKWAYSLSSRWKTIVRTFRYMLKLRKEVL